MKYLVFCGCGHALDRHTQDGCSGENSVRCACVNNQERALESAVEQARSQPWGAWRSSATPADAEIA